MIRNANTLPLWIAFILLLLIKCINSDTDYTKMQDICLLLADIVPGLGKRLIMLVGLTLGNKNEFGKVFSPFEFEVVEEPKKKRD